MKQPYTIYTIVFSVLFFGCTTVQTINKLEPSAGKLDLVCIVEHRAVRETVLEVIQEGLRNHGVKYRVIPGSYEIKDNLWMPTVSDDQIAGCDAMLFYVANWSWDITMYMRFANIWMTTADRKQKLGLATYDARASLNKFINAREKLLELTDGLFAQYKKPASPTQDNASTFPATTPAVPTVVTSPTVAKSNDTSSNSISQKLRELQALKKDGLITDDDYRLKKQQLLEKL